MRPIIVIESHIPFLQDVLTSYADVRFLPPESITPTTIADADALVIRTRTQCNASLLNGTNIRYILTATIGCDHIDMDYCQKNEIQVFSCPGCNAQAVCDYVEEVIQSYSQDPLLNPLGINNTKGLTLGVVGIGHVGSLVCKLGERLGMHVLKNDPPKQIGVDLEQLVQESDIITFHTPLTHSIPHATYHLCDASLLSKCRPNALIINAARGGIIDEHALLETQLPYVLDCWEGEPKINTQVLERAWMASYHIAGYSIEGKMNASQMCLDNLSKVFGFPFLSIDKKDVPLQGDNKSGWLMRITNQIKSEPSAFEELRKQYKLR